MPRQWGSAYADGTRPAILAEGPAGRTCTSSVTSSTPSPSFRQDRTLPDMRVPCMPRDFDRCGDERKLVLEWKKDKLNLRKINLVPDTLSLHRVTASLNQTTEPQGLSVRDWEHYQMHGISLSLSPLLPPSLPDILPIYLPACLSLSLSPPPHFPPKLSVSPLLPIYIKLLDFLKIFYTACL